MRPFALLALLVLCSCQEWKEFDEAYVGGGVSKSEPSTDYEMVEEEQVEEPCYCR